MTPSIVKSFIKISYYYKISLQNIVYYCCQSWARHNPLCPQRPPFFTVTASLFLCYSFFLSSHHGTKSHTVVIIIFYATNDFSFFLFFNFRIISKSILHNHSNSIRKLNYDRRKWANTFFFFFSFLHAFFFLGFELCYFFFFSFHAFLFFSFGVALFFFRRWTFSFFFLGGAEFVLRVFGLFSLFLIFWGLVFSLSLPRSPEQAAPK